MTSLLIPTMVFLAVMGLGGSVLLANRLRRKPLDDRLREVAGRNRDASRAKKSLTPSGLLGRWGAFFLPKRGVGGLQEELARAGYHAKNAAAVYLGAKMFLLFAGAGLLSLAVMPLSLPLSAKTLVVGTGAVSLFFVPNFLVSAKRNRYRLDIQNALPDALDLLEICVTSGMGLDMAWNSVAQEIRRVSPALSDQMALTDLEMHMGAPRTIAMRHMSDRTGCEELNSLVAILVQSERFGTSMADALRTFATSIREIRSHRCQEMAEKMAVKLILPMVIFIFPALMVILVGPAGITLNNVLGRP